jgi:hypothetical protein
MTSKSAEGIKDGCKLAMCEVHSMAIDTSTVVILETTLKAPERRKLFAAIAASRIATVETIKAEILQSPDQALNALKAADLIGEDTKGTKYYITARGLKVARDLESLPTGLLV